MRSGCSRRPTASSSASEEVAAILGERGIPAPKISVTGIPIMPAFARRLDRDAIRRRFGLSPREPVILVMSGGAGVGSMADTVSRVLACGSVQVLAVAGSNVKARRELEALAPPRASRLHVFGFVEDVAEVMAAADLVVGKSGGLTTAESLAMGLPMIALNPIPGQEERNADYLLECGAGVKAIGLAALSYKLAALLKDCAAARADAPQRSGGRPSPRRAETSSIRCAGCAPEVM